MLVLCVRRFWWAGCSHTVWGGCRVISQFAGRYKTFYLRYTLGSMADKLMNAALSVTNLCCLLALMVFDRHGITEGMKASCHVV